MSAEYEHLFKGIEHVQEHVLTVTMNSVLRYEVKLQNRDDLSYVILGGDAVKSRKFISLITEDYNLSFSGKQLTLSAVGNNVEFDTLPNEISEEWFFQLSTAKNFGSLQYEDIELVKTLFERKFQGD